MIKSASSFIILKIKQNLNNNDNKENLMFENYWRNMIEYNKNKLNNNFKPKEISLGDEIITINSNLCNLSYDHFSKSLI